MGEGLSVLLYCLLHQQLVLHGGGGGSHKSSSLMYLLKRIQKSTWSNSRGFLCENYKLQPNGFHQRIQVLEGSQVLDGD
ncbi:unnamed protein product, partial [Vitis vinifera]|uniref:Uncharacterized protein n=1 Tax=Vitis vinifera TaxID=29760 RepID=D7TXJ8_VITVI